MCSLKATASAAVCTFAYDSHFIMYARHSRSFASELSSAGSPVQMLGGTQCCHFPMRRPHCVEHRACPLKAIRTYHTIYITMFANKPTLAIEGMGACHEMTPHAMTPHSLDFALAQAYATGQRFIKLLEYTAFARAPLRCLMYLVPSVSLVPFHHHPKPPLPWLRRGHDSQSHAAGARHR